MNKEILEIGDFERNNSDEVVNIIDPQTGNIIQKIKASEMPIGIGLLWDQVKECGIKEYDLDDEK